MIRKMLVGATLLVAATTAAQATIVLSEGFDDISTLAGSGWSLINNSVPAGETGWFQGNLFDAHSGAADSYIAANLLNAGSGGAISNWLLSPTLTLNSATTLTFYTRTDATVPYADSLEIRFSQAGDSTNVGADGSFGDFASLALTINPTLSGDYPAEWTQYSVTFSDLLFGTTGRIAFRYVVPDTNVAGNYIGIDSFSVDVPEPSTFVLMFGMLVPLALAVRRRKADLKKLALGVSLAASATIATAADTPKETAQETQPAGLMTFPNVRVVNVPAAAPAPVTSASSGMRAYVDAKTKQLRDQEPEDVQQEAKAAAARPAAKSARSAAANASAPGTAIYGPGNAVGMMLGEDTMIFAVAHKQEDGKHAMECVTGEDAAHKALEHASTHTSHAAEVRNER